MEIYCNSWKTIKPHHGKLLNPIGSGPVVDGSKIGRACEELARAEHIRRRNDFGVVAYNCQLVGVKPTPHKCAGATESMYVCLNTCYNK